MKCLLAVAFLALVAVTLAGPVGKSPIPLQGEKPVEPVKTDDVNDVRDKRQLVYSSYPTAPVAYTSYSARTLPVAYSASLPLSYSYPYTAYTL